MLYGSQGFSFLEILISLGILSLILLGLDAVLLSTHQEITSSYFLNQAIIQMDSMRERLTIFHHPADLTKEIGEWNRQNSEVLPNGVGMVTGEYPFYTLKISWGKETLQRCEENKFGLSGCLIAINTL